MPLSVDTSPLHYTVIEVRRPRFSANTLRKLTPHWLIRDKGMTWYSGENKLIFPDVLKQGSFHSTGKRLYSVIELSCMFARVSVW